MSSELERRLAEIADALEPDAAAVMRWADPTDFDALLDVIRTHNAKHMHSSLSEKLARRLKSALRGKG